MGIDSEAELIRRLVACTKMASEAGLLVPANACSGLEWHAPLLGLSMQNPAQNVRLGPSQQPSPARGL